MSDQDLKVGDVCVIVSPATPPVVGLECTIIGPEKEYSKRISDTPAMEVWVSCFGFLVVTVDGIRMAIERQCLRKKPPKSDDSVEPRTEFAPADRDFIEDLRRQIKKPQEIES